MFTRSSIIPDNRVCWYREQGGARGLPTVVDQSKALALKSFWPILTLRPHAHAHGLLNPHTHAFHPHTNSTYPHHPHHPHTHIPTCTTHTYSNQLLTGINPVIVLPSWENGNHNIVSDTTIWNMITRKGTHNTCQRTSTCTKNNLCECSILRCATAVYKHYHKRSCIPRITSSAA